MGRIFLSYAREDRTFAERIAHVLEQAGHEVWWDRRLDGGEEFAAEIEAALAQAEVVLVAWSATAVRSRWVRDEASVGCDGGLLVPVTIDGCQAPMGFRQFHTLDLTGWKAGRKDRRTAELLHSVERRLKGERSFAQDGIARAAPRAGWHPGKLHVVAATLLLIALAAGVFIFTGREQGRQRPLKPTIALLPFAQSSADPQLRELGAQARDAIAHSFSQSGLPVRLVNSGSQQPNPDTDFLMSGEFSRTAGKVTATVRLDEAARGVTVFSRRFETEGGDTHDLAERIGAQMAGNLTWAAPLMALDRRRPLDPVIVADLLQAMDFTGDPLQAYQNTRRAVAKAPESAVTQTSIAFNTGFVLDQIPLNERAEVLAFGRKAAERALKLQPDFGDTYAIWCVTHSGALMAQCEDRLRAGRRVDPDAPFLNTFLAHVLRSVGRIDESLELMRLSYTHDVYVPTKIGWMLRMLQYSGDEQQARDLYAQGSKWWPEYRRDFFRQRLWGLLNRGNFTAMPRLEQEVGPEGLPQGYAPSDALVAALKARSLPMARTACPGSDNFTLNVRCMLVLSNLGGQDEAYAIAGKLYRRRLGRSPAETERIWLQDPAGEMPVEFVTGPAAAAMRGDRRYLDLAQRLGLLDYWRSGRPPDFCRGPRPEPVCRQLLQRN